jgi:hypothetical protein
MKLVLDSTRYLPGYGLFTEQESGEEYGDFKLTDAGISNHKDGWWYFMRKWDDKENPYWYKKRRTSATESNPEGEVVEEYVGLTLPFAVPREWLVKLRRRALSGGKA